MIEWDAVLIVVGALVGSIILVSALYYVVDKMLWG